MVTIIDFWTNEVIAEGDEVWAELWCEEEGIVICFKNGNEWTIEAAQQYVDKKWEDLLSKCK